VWKKCLIGVTLSTLLLAGCGKEGEETTKVVKDDNIFTIVMTNNDEFDLSNIKQLLQEKSGKKVEIKKVSADEKRKMMLSNQADMVLLTQDEIGFAKDEDLLKEVNVKDGMYISSAVEAMKYEGKQYAYPASFDIPFFIYNSDVIKEVPATLTQLKQYAKVETKQVEDETTKQMVEKSEVAKPYALYTDLTKYQTMEPFLTSYGYKPFNQDENGTYITNNVNVVTKGNEEAYGQMKELVQTTIPYNSLSRSALESLYNESQLYSFIGYKSQLENLTVANSFSVIPQVNENHTYKAPITVEGWAVMKTNQDEDMVNEFMNLVTADNYVKNEIDNFDTYTPVQHIDLKEYSPVTKVLYEQAENSYARPTLAQNRELTNPLERSFKWFVEDINDAKKTLEQAKQSIDFQISSNY